MNQSKLKEYYGHYHFGYRSKTDIGILSKYRYLIYWCYHSIVMLLCQSEFNSLIWIPSVDNEEFIKSIHSLIFTDHTQHSHPIRFINRIKFHLKSKIYWKCYSNHLNRLICHRFSLNNESKPIMIPNYFGLKLLIGWNFCNSYTYININININTMEDYSIHNVNR